ncbi:efflux transporter periplasmic adaptor subunit, partial [Pandoraea pneumonica]
ELTLEDGTAYPLEGKLQFSDITVDQTTGSVTVRAIFPNPNRELLPGMFVHAKLQEGVKEGGLLVPQQGVTRDQKGQPTALI